MINRDWIINLNGWCTFSISATMLVVNTLACRRLLCVKTKLLLINSWGLPKSIRCIIWTLRHISLSVHNSGIICFRSANILLFHRWSRITEVVPWNLSHTSSSIPRYLVLLLHLPIGLWILLPRVFNCLAFFVTYIIFHIILKLQKFPF